MYGKGSAFAGVGTTAAGIAILPNTSGNTILTLLNVATILLGAVVMSSFVVARVAALRTR